MSDDQLPDRAELASAYLDGELEADQRAVVENDPDAMAMVESFARIRTELNAFQPADDAVRSAALAAALADFDARPRTTVQRRPQPSSLPFRHDVIAGIA